MKSGATTAPALAASIAKASSNASFPTPPEMTTTSPGFTAAEIVTTLCAISVRRASVDDCVCGHAHKTKHVKTANRRLLIRFMFASSDKDCPVPGGGMRTDSPLGMGRPTEGRALRVGENYDSEDRNINY